MQAGIQVMDLDSPSKWPSIRRSLLILAALIVAMCIPSILSGRPDDIAAGLIGAVLGALFGFLASVIDLIRWFTAKAKVPKGTSILADEKKTTPDENQK